MANTEGSASNFPDESNCDNAIQDGKKSVRDIKFMFDKPAVARKPKSVVFPSHAGESSTDTMDTRIRKMKSMFEAPRVSENGAENPHGVGTEAKSKAVRDSVVQDSTAKGRRTEAKSKPVRDSVAQEGTSEGTEVDSKAVRESVVQEGTAEGTEVESKAVCDSVVSDGTAEIKKSVKSPVRDSVGLRASTVITSSFSFLSTFDDLDKENTAQHEGDSLEVLEKKRTDNTAVNSTEAEGHFAPAHDSKEVDDEEQYSEVHRRKEMSNEAQGKDVQGLQDVEAHRIENEMQYESVHKVEAEGREVVQDNDVKDSKEAQHEAQDKETGNEDVKAKDVDEVQSKDETQYEAQEAPFETEAHEVQAEALGKILNNKEGTDKRSDADICISQTNEIAVEGHKSTCPGDLTTMNKTVDTSEKVSDAEVDNDESENLSKSSRKSAGLRASEFISNSFSFLPQDDDNYQNDDDPQNIDSASVPTVQSTSKPESSHVFSPRNDVESEDSIEGGVVTNSNDGQKSKERVESASELSRSSSQSSTDSAVLRSAEKRESIHKVTRQASRKGFFTEAGSNLDQHLSKAILDDQLRRNSDQDIESEICKSGNSTGSSSESPRLRPKVERSLSSGSYDGSRTLERLRSRSRSRSNSPGVSDGSDDDEDDDEGIYAETFRYSSYMFVGDDDLGEMSFSASTPDFSTLTRKKEKSTDCDSA